jgi:tyrosinase
MPLAPARPLLNSDPAIHHRLSVYNLTAEQLGALRDGVKKMKQVRDSRGFAFLAGVHGWPQGRCQHSSEHVQATLFLPWHRAYLYEFELALQERNPDARLCWWDWPASRQDGIPPAYADAQAEAEANPLASSPLPTDIPKRPPDWTAETFRSPSDPSELPDVATINKVLDEPNYYGFELELETQLHNLVHGWVGGSMGQINTAAYDPLFWAHHTMVDRLWSLWQTKHASPGPPPETYSTPLGFGKLTVADVLDTMKLGYDYAAAVEHVPVPAGGN